MQDSAAPWHDWNERVTVECYAPNTAARRVGDDNRILDIVDNYEKISFDFGPTLLSWLERHRPDVYAKILEADRLSRQTRGGHGNAIAQVYNHAILPLCTRRDKVTQVRWGLEDFRHRFGREPEGMWLAETAVDAESLEVLAEAGVKFTILAPHQAARIRPLDAETWEPAGDHVDPSRAYLWRSPAGPTLALFFYDAPISRAIAFEDGLSRGEVLAERLRHGFDEARGWPQIVHCATDGESYGHHTPFGDMALAAALQQLEREGFAPLTNYGQFLAAHPPTHEAEIRDNTSWSCAHGVERWRADCGCRTRPDWHQRWRGPLREALDWLRDQVDLVYERRAAALLKDPWEARDDYVRVVLDRSPEARADWFARHRLRPLDEAEQVKAMVDLRRVIAHYAISSLFESWGEEERIYAYTVRRLDEQGVADGGTALRVGRVAVRAEVTGETDEAVYAVLHYGGHDFHCGVRGSEGREAYDTMAAELRRTYAAGALSDMVRALDRHFPGAPYTLRHLFLDGRRKILAAVTDGVLERNEPIYRRIWEENRKLVRYLRDVDGAVP
ncbi:MAG: DUF3536 domain-containing protein, partial [Candidatus Rokubacteria bacterium]|nr:DUF3536 domain-containing protein [Candidatus Rokubacteria bacterium]